MVPSSSPYVNTSIPMSIMTQSDTESTSSPIIPQQPSEVASEVSSTPANILMGMTTTQIPAVSTTPITSATPLTSITTTSVPTPVNEVKTVEEDDEPYLVYPC